MCHARLPSFFILFFTDVTRSSDCIVSLYEVSVWAVSFSWHRGLSRPLLWFRISTLVFNWVNNYQNTEDFGNTANVDLTCCLSILCCFLFSSFTDNSFNLTFSVYSGHHTILIPPGDLETNPALWLSVVSQYKGEFCSLLWMILLPTQRKKYEVLLTVFGFPSQSATRSVLTLLWICVPRDWGSQYRRSRYCGYFVWKKTCFEEGIRLIFRQCGSWRIRRNRDYPPTDLMLYH